VSDEIAVLKNESATSLIHVSCESDVECRYAAKLVELQNQIAQLNGLVRTDALTQLFNFRFFSEALPLEMERTRRTLLPLSLILVDIDHFKQINDVWGHEIGNKALIHVAMVIRDVLRRLDFPCRYGGEEFALILPSTALNRAVSVAERLREKLENTPFVVGNEAITVTASLGVVEFDRLSGESAENLLSRVDERLYWAKMHGRNCVAHSPYLSIPTSDTQVSAEEKQILFGSSGT
jgi:diguanylate cyclase (GGDEF)-like protein